MVPPYFYRKNHSIVIYKLYTTGCKKSKFSNIFSRIQFFSAKGYSVYHSIRISTLCANSVNPDKL